MKNPPHKSGRPAAQTNGSTCLSVRTENSQGVESFFRELSALHFEFKTCSKSTAEVGHLQANNIFSTPPILELQLVDVQTQVDLLFVPRVPSDIVPILRNETGFYSPIVFPQSSCQELMFLN